MVVVQDPGRRGKWSRVKVASRGTVEHRLAAVFFVLLCRGAGNDELWGYD